MGFVEHFHLRFPKIPMFSCSPREDSKCCLGAQEGNDNQGYKNGSSSNKKLKIREKISQEANPTVQ